MFVLPLAVDLKEKCTYTYTLQFINPRASRLRSVFSLPLTCSDFRKHSHPFHLHEIIYDDKVIVTFALVNYVRSKVCVLKNDY